MKFFSFFKRSNKHDFCEHIIASSSPKGTFYLYVVLSTLIVVMGIVKNNIVLVIGGMLVAPLLSPILAVSLGLVILDFKALVRSLKIFFMSFALSIVISYIFGMTMGYEIENIGLITLLEPSFFAFFVSLLAGLAASYAWASPDYNSTMPGTVIAVTIIPPLTLLGLSMASGNFEMFNRMLQLVGINVLGIILASLVVFFVMDFSKAKKQIISDIKEEEKELKK